jgi:hypothetical protein
MKSRNKEVNIFNMSLLDILCGALGTFAFMMIVLFPYYSIGKDAKPAPEIPPGVDPKTFEEAKARIQQLEDTLKKFQDYAKDLENQVTQLKAQNKQLQDEAKSTGSTMDQMQMRNPFVGQLFFLASGPDDQADICVYDDRTSTDNKKHTPKPDVTKSEPIYWYGDVSTYGHAGAYYMVRDTPAGKYHIYLKVIKHDPAAGPFLATGSVATDAQFEQIPRFLVTESQALVEVAVVTVTYNQQDKDKPYTQKIEVTVPKERLANAETQTKQK